RGLARRRAVRARGRRGGRRVHVEGADLEEADLVGTRERLCPAVHAQLWHEVLEVARHGLWADNELPGDSGRVESVCEKRKHLELSGGEAVPTLRQRLRPPLASVRAGEKPPRTRA